MYSLGLMSGTSMDGIDAAVLDTDGKDIITELEHHAIAYDTETKILLKTAECIVNETQGDLEQADIHYFKTLHIYLQKELSLTSHQATSEIKALKNYIEKALRLESLPRIQLQHVIQLSTQWHLKAILALKHISSAIQPMDIIGYHGQTVFHQPQMKKTIQLGDPAWLSEQTMTPVIYDFRGQDVASGGQGAPFAPLYHQALAKRDDRLPLIVINCGGIANLTLISGPDIADVVGFDTGPGNTLIDTVVKRQTQGKAFMDKDGAFGLQGRVDENLIEILFQTVLPHRPNYFQEPAPKSLDVRDFALPDTLHMCSLEDACATLAAFTAESIVRGFQSLQCHETMLPKRWVIAGGGSLNPVILRELRLRAHQACGIPIQICTADDMHWHSQALEAQLFAYFAVRSLKKLPLSTPKTTRTPYPMTGGKLCLPPGTSLDKLGHYL